MLLTKIGALATKSLIVVSMLSASTTASAAACQAGPGGCVLPIADAPPSPPISEAPRAPYEAGPIVAETAGGGFSLIAILAGIVAIGLLAYLLLDDDDEGEGPPVTP